MFVVILLASCSIKSGRGPAPGWACTRALYSPLLSPSISSTLQCSSLNITGNLQWQPESHPLCWLDCLLSSSRAHVTTNNSGMSSGFIVLRNYHGQERQRHYQLGTECGHGKHLRIRILGFKSSWIYTFRTKTKKDISLLLISHFIRLTRTPSRTSL